MTKPCNPARISSDLPETMPAPRFAGQGIIQTRTRPVPRPGPGQLLLRVKANALCGSERFQFYSGTDITPGHEAAGIVVAAGEDTATPLGTPGVVFLMDFCGQCRSCRMGFTNQCTAKRADMGFSQDGGYGLYELVHENIFFPVDESIPLTDATILLDIMGTGGHAIGRAKLLRSDIESVLVTGAGPIGLGVLAMARILLASAIPVLVADVLPYRLELVRKLGGQPIDLKQGPLADQMKSLYGVAQADIAIDTAGKTAARQAAIDALGKRGVLVCVGHGEELRLDISPQMIAPERAVLGSEYFRYDELAGNLKLFRQNRAYLNQIITHRYGPDQLQKAFELFFQGNTGKVVIEQ